MEKKQQRHTENSRPENDTSVKDREQVLIPSKSYAKRKLDQTIRPSEKYLSWYQYETKNIDKYLQLCPHCKKPTMSAFHRAVINSATHYLNGNRAFEPYLMNKGNFLAATIFALIIGTVVYFLFVIN